MKIRNGYISNSSSSSFVIFGKEITMNEAKTYVNEQETFAIGEGCGSSGVCEDYVVLLTPARLNIIFENKDLFRSFRFFASDFSSYVRDEIVKLPNIKDKQMYFFERDYSSPSFDSEFLDFIKERDC